MATRSDIRKARLKSDFQEMKNILGGIVQWKVTKGQEPYAEEYELIINIKSIVGSAPDYRNQHRIKLSLPSGYPIDASPELNMLSKPYPYHPNWWDTGLWCPGTWNFSEGLGHFVIRMLRTLQFDPSITNENDAANRKHKQWYVLHKKSGLFPCDRQQLPDPTKKKIVWESEQSAMRNNTNKLKFL